MRLMTEVHLPDAIVKINLHVTPFGSEEQPILVRGQERERNKLSNWGKDHQSDVAAYDLGTSSNKNWTQKNFVLIADTSMSEYI